MKVDKTSQNDFFFRKQNSNFVVNKSRQIERCSALCTLNVNKVARIFHGNLNFDLSIFYFQKVEHYLMV